MISKHFFPVSLHMLGIRGGGYLPDMIVDLGRVDMEPDQTFKTKPDMTLEDTRILPDPDRHPLVP